MPIRWLRDRVVICPYVYKVIFALKCYMNKSSKIKYWHETKINKYSKHVLRISVEVSNKNIPNDEWPMFAVAFSSGFVEGDGWDDRSRSPLHTCNTNVTLIVSISHRRRCRWPVFCWRRRRPWQNPTHVRISDYLRPHMISSGDEPMSAIYLARSGQVSSHPIRSM
jgi:hypothetical protein